MRLLINTLSIGSMSGEHVVYGFLRPLIKALSANDKAFILHYESQLPPDDIKAPNLSMIAVSNRWRHWALRTLLEVIRLPTLIKNHSIDRVLNVSGAITPGLKVPQISLAMNPWCFVKAARSGWLQEIKAFMQRRGYRFAFRHATHVVYISDHLRSLYRRANADCLGVEADSTIAWVGLNDDLFEAAKRLRSAPRTPHSILSVSAFAPWKGTQTVIEAVQLLRKRGIPATLSLVGPWPDPMYEKSMRDLVANLNLQDSVTIHGKIEVSELHQMYSRHQVFCLMSSCESFGIPAAEAMGFGTPVVSTDFCAIAEVCEGAGLFGPADDAAWTANALSQLLTDKDAWNAHSDVARRKSAQLTWQQCALPWLGIPAFNIS